MDEANAIVMRRESRLQFVQSDRIHGIFRDMDELSCHGECRAKDSGGSPVPCANWADHVGDPFLLEKDDIQRLSRQQEAIMSLEVLGP